MIRSILRVVLRRILRWWRRARRLIHARLNAHPRGPASEISAAEVARARRDVAEATPEERRKAGEAARRAMESLERRDAPEMRDSADDSARDH